MRKSASSASVRTSREVGNWRRQIPRHSEEGTHGVKPPVPGIGLFSTGTSGFQLRGHFTRRRLPQSLDDVQLGKPKFDGRSLPPGNQTSKPFNIRRMGFPAFQSGATSGATPCP